MKTNKQISIAAFLSILVLSGCTNTPSSQTNTPPISTPIAQEIPEEKAVETVATVTNNLATPETIIKEEELSYMSPAGPEKIKVNISSQDGVITKVLAIPLATDPISLKLQTGFAEKVSESVVGKTIKGFKVDTVSGASLTTGAFNEFLTKNSN